MKPWTKRDDETFDNEVSAEKRVDEINQEEPGWTCPFEMKSKCVKSCYCFLDAFAYKPVTADDSGKYEVRGFDCENAMFSHDRIIHS